MTGKREKSTIVGRFQAGRHHEVVSIEGRSRSYKRKPCDECPWRKDKAGSFPPEAFKHSANTATDMSEHTFACHMAGPENPAVCAGFLMMGADHNLAVRMRYMSGAWDFDSISDGGFDLWDSYVAMAVGNGVDPDDAALKDCRGNDE